MINRILKPQDVKKRIDIVSLLYLKCNILLLVESQSDTRKNKDSFKD